MELWIIFRQRLRALAKRRQLDRDLEDEIAFHLAMKQQKLRAEGMSPGDAAAASARAFGNTALLRERTREVWLFRWLEELAQDLRYALRGLRKTPLLAAVVVLSLALGIGANTAIFSLMNAVMLRLLPVQRPEELMTVVAQYPGEPPHQSFSNALWEATRDQQDVFSGTLAWSGPEEFDLAQGGAVQDARGLFVSGDYFNILGVMPSAGRLFSSADDYRGCPAVAVLSYGFWHGRFGGAANVVGSVLLLRGHAFQVVGVAVPHFHGVEVGKDFDIALPICSAAPFDKRNLDSSMRWWLNVMGRVKPEMSSARMEARLAALSPSIMKAALPEGRTDWEKRFLARKLVAKPAATGASNLRQAFGEPLMVMMVMVAIVLLIACANITSLMLARATTREKEIAIRKALGASRGRVTKQLLTESVLLSMCGAAVGLLFAKWGSALLVRNLSTGRQPIFLDTSLNLPVLGFTSVIAVLTGILMGFLPAMRSTRVDLTEAMKARATKTGLPSSRSRAGRWIVAAQVALSLLLLVAGGLLLRTFVKLMTLDPGFDRHNVLIVNASPPWWAQDDAKVPPERRSAVDNELLRRMRALPGAVSAARSFTSPIGEDNWWQEIHTGVANAPTGEAASMLLNFISPGYLATLNMRLLSGRDFTEHDTGASQFVAIINETAAHRFYPGINPIGKQFRWGEEPNVVQIVGIVKDAKYQSMREESYPTIFLPATQMPARGSADVFELRTALAPDAMVPLVQRAITDVSPLVSMAFHTLKQQVDDNLVQERLLAELAGFFGALALVLAMIGLYGTMSYAVTQRQVEFGIRMALGARRGSILQLVMRDVALVLTSGLAAGIAVSLASVKVLNRLVYGLDPRDSATMIGAAVLLAIMALAAGYLPARRATRVDPMVALRYE